MRKALAVLLLGLLLVVPARPATANHQPRLLWIPLDSRPVNTDEVSLFAEAGGLQVLLPPSDQLDWYASRRSDFTGLLGWLRANSRRGDMQVIYTNSLLTGGLIASRDASSYAELAQRSEALRETLVSLPAGRRVLVHVLPRLLPTQFRPDGSPDPDYAWAELLAERSERLHRLARTRSATDRARLRELEAMIPETVANRYDQLIHYNRLIANTLVAWAREGIVSYVVVGLDDSAPQGMANALHEQVQSRTRAFGIEDRVFPHLGADEIGFLILAREAMQRAGISPSLWVQYDQDRAPGLLLPYEGGPLKESVDQKLAFLRARLDRTAPHQIFLHTSTDLITSGQTVRRIAQARSGGHALTVVDVTSPGQPDNRFLVQLGSHVSLAGINYAGWNTASNAIGTGLAMASLTDLHQKRGATAEQAMVLERFRALRIGYDWAFQSRKADLNRWATQHGIDPNSLGQGRSATLAHLQGDLGPMVHGTLQKALGGSLVDVDGLAYPLCVGRPTLALRWDRTFEVEVRPKLSLGSPPRTRCRR